MIAAETHRFAAQLWRWTSESHGTWHFFTVPEPVAAALDAAALMHRLETGKRSGFGSVRLTVRLGDSEWATSAFPIAGRGWSIPVSAKVRKAEGLVADDPISVEIAF